jgi:hypothetical protein
MAFPQHKIEREGEAGANKGKRHENPASPCAKANSDGVGHDPDHEHCPSRQDVDSQKGRSIAAIERVPEKRR